MFSSVQRVPTGDKIERLAARCLVQIIIVRFILQMAVVGGAIITCESLETRTTSMVSMVG